MLQVVENDQRTMADGIDYHNTYNAPDYYESPLVSPYYEAPTQAPQYPVYEVPVLVPQVPVYELPVEVIPYYEPPIHEPEYPVYEIPVEVLPNYEPLVREPQYPLYETPVEVPQLPIDVPVYIEPPSTFEPVDIGVIGVPNNPNNVGGVIDVVNTEAGESVEPTTGLPVVTPPIGNGGGMIKDNFQVIEPQKISFTFLYVLILLVAPIAYLTVKFKKNR